nr:immunoglobulin light chain junction region [Macaca mulatta]
CNSYADSNVLC